MRYLLKNLLKIMLRIEKSPVFMTTLLFVLISSFLSGSNGYLKKSASYPLFSYSSKVILTFIQDYDLRSYFIPREPAIKLSPFKKSSGIQLQNDQFGYSAFVLTRKNQIRGALSTIRQAYENMA